jgi:hypothetical protein
MSDPAKQQKHLVDEALRLLNEQYESNTAFNEDFDGDEPLSIESLREGVDTYQYERSKILFCVDRDAYEDERAAWDNKALYERHQEAINLLEANGYMAPFRDLVDAVVRQRAVPFVGAGLSRPMGMPLWAEALRELHTRIHNVNDPIISTLIDEGRLLEAAQALADSNQVLTDNFIRTKYRVQKLIGPILYLSRIAQGCIVTTNFDDAIEEVFRQENILLDGHMYGKEEHNFFSRLVRGQRCLLKLHGDADNPRTYVLSRGQYRDAYGEPFNFQLPLPKAIRQIFISNTLVFLGCSLEQDWTRELFRTVRQQSEYEIPNHYALLPQPEGPGAIQEKEAALLDLNIQPLWYPAGQHEFVDRLLRLVIDVADKRISFSLPGTRP